MMKINLFTRIELMLTVLSSGHSLKKKNGETGDENIWLAKITRKLGRLFTA